MTGKTLVAYFTKGGASETYAKAIAEELKSKGVQVDLANLRSGTSDVGGYDTVVVGTGVRISMVYGRWKKILKQKQLKEKRLFVFLSSGMAMEEPEKAVDKWVKPIVEKYGLSPVSMVSSQGHFPRDGWRQRSRRIS